MPSFLSEQLEPRTLFSFVAATGAAVPVAAPKAVHATPKLTASNIVLTVNTVTHEMRIIGALPGTIITAYSVGSASGSLIVYPETSFSYGAGSFEANPNVYVLVGKTHRNNWQGIRNTKTLIAEGPGTSYGPNNPATWTNQAISAKGISLGTRFKSKGTKDITFLWSDKNLKTYRGTVRYVT